MTHTIIIGQQETDRKKMLIEFHHKLDTPTNVVNTSDEPNQYNYVELISLNYDNGYDVMFAYDDPNKRNEGVLFIGKWNDGVVE